MNAAAGLIRLKSGPFLIGLVFFQCCLLPAVWAERVRYVIDGDTVVLETEERVRLIGIDAPEVDNPRYNRIGEFYGQEAKAYLKERIEGKQVRLEPGHEPYDKYGRRLAYIYLDGALINAELVEKGYAEAMRFFDYEFKEHFLELEAAARRQGTGMWDKTRMEAAGRKERQAALAGWVFVALIVLLAIYFFWKKV